jgi:hypothetical protein
MPPKLVFCKITNHNLASLMEWQHLFAAGAVVTALQDRNGDDKTPHYITLQWPLASWCWWFCQGPPEGESAVCSMAYDIIFVAVSGGCMRIGAHVVAQRFRAVMLVCCSHKVACTAHFVEY